MIPLQYGRATIISKKDPWRMLIKTMCHLLQDSFKVQIDAYIYTYICEDSLKNSLFHCYPHIQPEQHSIRIEH